MNRLHERATNDRKGVGDVDRAVFVPVSCTSGHGRSVSYTESSGKEKRQEEKGERRAGRGGRHLAGWRAEVVDPQPHCFSPAMTRT